MNGVNKRPIWEKWLWEREALTVFVPFMILTPVAAACILYLFWGRSAIFVLAFAIAGFACWGVYGTVGRKVESLRQSIPPEEDQAVDSLIVDGLIQSPGVVVLKDDEIALHPILGEAIVLRSSDVASFRQVRWFNGTLLLFKTGFWLNVPGRGRLGFAVPDSFVAVYRQRLTS